MITTLKKEIIKILQAFTILESIEFTTSNSHFLKKYNVNYANIHIPSLTNDISESVINRNSKYTLTTLKISNCSKDTNLSM
jgi:hypothetical protein